MRIKSHITLCFIAALAVPSWGQTARDMSARYPVVNAYEVRPGILMAAKYAEDGQVCEMRIEKWHQMPEKTELGSTMPRALIRQIIDELAPLPDRGKPTKRYLRDNSESTISGNIEVTESEFEKVSIEIIGSVSPGASGDVTASIRWKDRVCASSNGVRDHP
jgi:hypothetical protein